MQSSVNSRLKIASYNVHSCVGTDRRYKPARIGEVINRIDPHIIGLQEIDTGYRLKYRDNQLDKLETLTGLDAIEGPTIIKSDCFYGNAILTSLPVLSIRRYDLSFDKREPRGLLDVDLLLDEKPVRFMVAHLGLRPKERKMQARVIVDALHENRIQPLTVLCGDFNDFIHIGPAIRIIQRHMGKTSNCRTFPSVFPVLPLDKIWMLSRGAQPYKFFTVRDRLTRLASDHLPIYVEAVY